MNWRPLWDVVVALSNHNYTGFEKWLLFMVACGAFGFLWGLIEAQERRAKSLHFLMRYNRKSDTSLTSKGDK